MLETYKAVLHGDKIEWQTDSPKITRGDKSVEVIITILEESEETEEFRPFGLGKGEFVVPDDFDAPLPEEVLASFEQ